VSSDVIYYSTFTPVLLTHRASHQQTKTRCSTGFAAREL
jgi:hypothetical protein